MKLTVHSISQTPLNFEQKTSPEVVNNSGNKAYRVSQESHSYLHMPRCQYGASASRPLPGGLGLCGKAKEQAVMGGLGPNGLKIF